MSERNYSLRSIIRCRYEKRQNIFEINLQIREIGKNGTCQKEFEESKKESESTRSQAFETHAENDENGVDQRCLGFK